MTSYPLSLALEASDLALHAKQAAATATIRINLTLSWWDMEKGEIEAQNVSQWKGCEGYWIGCAAHFTVTVSLKTKECDTELLAKITYHGIGVSPPLHQLTLHADTASLLTDGDPPRGLKIAYCGANSRSPTSRSYVQTLPPGHSENGWWVGAWSSSAGSSIVLGSSSCWQFITEINLTHSSITATQHLEHWDLRAGEELSVEAFWCAICWGSPLRQLESFASALGRRHSALSSQSPCGWGTWGHWLERIDVGLVRETLRDIEGDAALSSALRIVQIDDGWSEMLESGKVSVSWHANRRFPAGIAPLASEIMANGRECGLWLLPFTVNAGSFIALHHPEWLVQDKTGEPLKVGGANTYCLDPTHPSAARWLQGLFKAIASWGVQYFKLDHLRALLSPEPKSVVDGLDDIRRFHNAKTRVEAYRAGLKLVREAVGPTATIVACSAPAALGTGYVNTHRVGPDIESSWDGRHSGVRDAARAVIANWFWHGKAWVNDPDYLLSCNSDALTRFWATVVSLSGGSVILSTNLGSLRAKDLEILAKVTPSIGRAAIPVDLFENPLAPRRLVLSSDKAAIAIQFVGVLNWKDDPTIDPNVFDYLNETELGALFPVHVFDVWRQRHKIHYGGPLSVALEGTDGAILAIQQVRDFPQIVGSDIHVAIGMVDGIRAQWNSVTFIFSISLDDSAPRSGNIMVWYPPRLTPSDPAIPESPDGCFSLKIRKGEKHQIKFRET